MTSAESISSGSSVYTHASEGFSVTYACICGTPNPPVDSAAVLYIQCTSCRNWQHTLCMGLAFQDIPTEHYWCQECQAEVWQSSQGDSRSSSPMSVAHWETLEAVGNGRRIWEERIAAFLALRRVVAKEDGREEDRTGVDCAREDGQEDKRLKEAGEDGSQQSRGRLSEADKSVSPERASSSEHERLARQSRRIPKLASGDNDRKWFD